MTLAGPLAWALAAGLTAAPALAGALAVRAGAIDAPERGTEVTPAGPLRVGRGEIVPAPGAHIYTLVAQGAPCGLLVDGKGKLRYRVEDRFSMPVAQRNVKRVSQLHAERDGTALMLTSDLDGAVVWGWGLADGLAALPAPAEPAKASARKELPGWAREIVVDRRFPSASHGLLAEEANGGVGLRYALLHGEDDELLLQVDPVTTEENLYQLVRARDPGQTIRQAYSAIALASQPLGRAWWTPPRHPLVAVQEAMRVENPAGELVKVVFRSRLEAQVAAVGLWQADLVDVITDEGGKRLPVTVRGARVDGQEVDFLHENDELLVPFGRRLAAGQSVEVEVTYDGALAQRPGGNRYWVLGTWPWYPRQGLGGELATMDIEVDVPAELMPFASGSRVKLTVDGKRRRLVTRADHAMQYAVVAAGAYEEVEGTAAGITCRAATYAMPNARAAEELLTKFFSGGAMLAQMLDTPYPFADLSIVQLSDWGFGQAPPSVIFFTNEFYTAPIRFRAFFQDRDARVLHEIAHGWWGHVAKMGSSSESWWTESLADYTAALALWRLRGGKPGAHAFDEIVYEWRRAASELAPGASLYLADRLAATSDRNFEDYWRLRYGKGPLVIHALRLELQRLEGGVEQGDRYFIAFLRAFLKRNPYGFGTTPDMVAILDELTGTDWQPWFERFVYGTEIPQLPK